MKQTYNKPTITIAVCRSAGMLCASAGTPHIPVELDKEDELFGE